MFFGDYQGLIASKLGSYSGFVYAEDQL